MGRRWADLITTGSTSLIWLAERQLKAHVGLEEEAKKKTENAAGASPVMRDMTADGTAVLVQVLLLLLSRADPAVTHGNGNGNGGGNGGDEARKWTKFSQDVCLLAIRFFRVGPSYDDIGDIWLDCLDDMSEALDAFPGLIPLVVASGWLVQIARQMEQYGTYGLPALTMSAGARVQRNVTVAAGDLPAELLSAYDRFLTGLILQSEEAEIKITGSFGSLDTVPLPSLKAAILGASIDVR